MEIPKTKYQPGRHLANLINRVRLMGDSRVFKQFPVAFTDSGIGMEVSNGFAQTTYREQSNQAHINDVRFDHHKDFDNPVWITEGVIESTIDLMFRVTAPGYKYWPGVCTAITIRLHRTTLRENGVDGELIINRDYLTLWGDAKQLPAMEDRPEDRQVPWEWYVKTWRQYVPPELHSHYDHLIQVMEEQEWLTQVAVRFEADSVEANNR